MEYMAKGGQSDVFNLGNGVGFSVKEIVEASERATGFKIPVKIEKRRAGDPARLIASSEKAKKILGWNPCHDSLEEIISSAWNWHKNHPDGYGK